mgnify:CR=1 FL=1
MEPQRTIIIADDHPLFRAALHQALYQTLGNLHFVEADDFSAAEELAEAYPDAELMLLDLMMPGASGLSGLAYLRGQYPDLPVAVISAHDDPTLIHRTLELGASGFIPKSATLPTLLSALQTIFAGDIWLPPELPPPTRTLSEWERNCAERLGHLTRQQFRVLMLMTEGLLNKQIADRLQISEATAKAHVTAVLRKLGAHSRTQAAVAFQSLAIEQREQRSLDG